MAHLTRFEIELSDQYFAYYLKLIENNIHNSKNRTRDAMNIALIAIGIRNKAFEKLAISTAKRIGKVEIDHGETSCKTLDAIEYKKNKSL